MKKSILSIVLLAGALMFGSCTTEQRNAAQAEAQEEIQELKEEIEELRSALGQKEKNIENMDLDFTDHGPDFFSVDIEDYTDANTNFRTTLWTGHQMQLTLMSIPVGGDIGEEIHGEIEQFIRIESGEGEVFIGETQETMKSVKRVGDDDIVFIPRGVWHNIKNIGDEPIKLYSIYAPTEHPKGTIHVTMEEGQEHDH
ncbi:MAG: cupin domain-containing protein [Porphyromonas sp.]|nr:cupin domain-containing protein [Porphyromonas sp.]